MKKLFAIVLAVVMVLSVASIAFAGAWDKAADSKTPFGYDIEVIKFTRTTGALGSATFTADPNAVAVNGADVYYAIKLVVPDIKDTDDIRVNAYAKVSFTAIDGTTSVDKIALKGLGAGTYYFSEAFIDSTGAKQPAGFYPITTFGTFGGTSKTAETAVYARACLDTDTAKVYAKVWSERPLEEVFEVGSYYVCATNGKVGFFEAKADAQTFAGDTTKLPAAATGHAYTVFNVKGNGQVTGVAAASDGQFTTGLYIYLEIGYQEVKDGKVYMSDDNLRAFLGFGYKDESSITWKANTQPIILDPTVTIPKTGDNASVIGFAMIMVAVVAAAVAVKKVKA